MTVDELIAHSEIRQTMINYNIAGDLQRKDEAAAQFAPDGVLKFGNVVARGHAEITAALTGTPNTINATPGVRHNLTTSNIVLQGDEATGRTYFLVVTAQGPSHQGLYLDRFKKLDGRWLIVEREVRVDWQGSATRMQQSNS